MKLELTLAVWDLSIGINEREPLPTNLFYLTLVPSHSFVLPTKLL